MAKMAEDASKEDFRDRSRREYEERRAEGRLGASIFFLYVSDLLTRSFKGPVQRTCATLDEKAGIFVRRPISAMIAVGLTLFLLFSSSMYCG